MATLEGKEPPALIKAPIAAGAAMGARWTPLGREHGEDSVQVHPCNAAFIFWDIDRSQAGDDRTLFLFTP